MAEASAGRVQVLEYSDQLGSWTDIETSIPLTAEVVFTDAGDVGRPAPGAVPSRYYRVRRKGF